MSLKNIVTPIVEPGLDVEFKSATLKTLNIDNLTLQNLNVVNKTTTNSLKVNGLSNTIGSAAPNTNTTNGLDVYSGLGMSLAFQNTYYGYNVYFDSGTSSFRSISNGVSAIIKLSTSGNIQFLCTSVSAPSPNSVVSFTQPFEMSPNGILKIPSQVKPTQSYLELKNNVGQSIPNSLSSPAVYNSQTVVSGTGISYNAGVFTINQNGIYSICWDCLWVPQINGYRKTFLLYNGVEYGDTTNNPEQAGGSCSLSSSCQIKLNSSDTFQIYLFQSSGGPLNTIAQNISIYQLPSQY